VTNRPLARQLFSEALSRKNAQNSISTMALTLTAENLGEAAAQEEEPEWKKFSYYDLEVDPDQRDRAVELKLGKFSRPHMRGFQFAWLSFFVATFVWLAIYPIENKIQATLQLTESELFADTMASMIGTTLICIILGPLCDNYGPRVLILPVLCTASIALACLGFVNSGLGFITLRIFTGMAGGVFVMSQYWVMGMFTKEVTGTAAGLVGGWGTLGGAIAYIVIESGLYPLFKLICGGDEELAWRTVLILPAAIAFTAAILIYQYSDDAPKGNFDELKAHGYMKSKSIMGSLCSAAQNLNMWILTLQYACTSGSEIATEVSSF
jgi:NNP family nitrate/nitrite transporter-like MFS transporter